ncbi:MAG: 30S ribosomal protein S16 [Planctomycetota bacterium]
MAVRIRMKKMGRSHRHFFRICAIDKRSPRDGRALEELGTYDPTIADVHARAVLKKDRIDYWLSVGAQPSEKMAVLIKKYGTDGTHLAEQAAALEKLAMGPEMVDPGEPASQPAAAEPEAPPAEAQAPPAEPEAASTETESAEPEAAEPEASAGSDSADAKPADDKPADDKPADGEEAKAEGDTQAAEAEAKPAEA